MDSISKITFIYSYAYKFCTMVFWVCSSMFIYYFQKVYTSNKTNRFGELENEVINIKYWMDRER